MLQYTPRDILEYVKKEKLEFKILEAITYHRQDYSIAEITDREYIKSDKGFRLVSKGLKIDIEIIDDDVLTALFNELYVSSFISRFKDDYQVHFLVHSYPSSMKAKFDENIADEVIEYIILKTIITLKLDSPHKIDEYLSMQ